LRYSPGNMWPGKLSARDDVHIKAIARGHGKTPTQVCEKNICFFAHERNQ
jgi:hypothetical protein